MCRKTTHICDLIYESAARTTPPNHPDQQVLTRGSVLS